MGIIKNRKTAALDGVLESANNFESADWESIEENFSQLKKAMEKPEKDYQEIAFYAQRVYQYAIEAKEIKLFKFAIEFNKVI